MPTDVLKDADIAGSGALQRIRQAALNRAAEDIRRQRLALLQDFQCGRISKEEYQKSLLKIIMQSREVSNSLKKIHENMGT